MAERDVSDDLRREDVGQTASRISAVPGLRQALVELQNGDPSVPGNEPEYVAGTQNFYVITRYNWSSYYAMAVIELGQAIESALRS